MTRNLLPALAILWIGALVGGACAAGAQRPETLSPAAPAAEASVVTSRDAATLPALGHAFSIDPLFATTSIVRSSSSFAVPDAAAPAVAIDWRMPSSRALIVGGTATALVGLFVVKREAGAAMACVGGAAAIYGLYLRFR